MRKESAVVENRCIVRITCKCGGANWLDKSRMGGAIFMDHMLQYLCSSTGSTG